LPVRHFLNNWNANYLTSTPNTPYEAIVIGSGFSGLSAACHLARSGVQVSVFETHDRPGGRARSFSEQGYTWDMGPSWYWMPDVFEHFFANFGKKPSDYYTLKRLDPSYQVVWQDEMVSIPAGMPELEALFERYEAGAALKLRAFLKESGTKYQQAMQELVYQPGISIREFLRMDVMKSLLKMDLLQSVARHARRYFRHPKLLQLVEFPILFLGALPSNTPAMYTLMNYADMVLGTWYPMGGMVRVVEAMVSLASSLGVNFHYSSPVDGFEINKQQVAAVFSRGQRVGADLVIAACDYHYAESLLPPAFRNYSNTYWTERKMAPSSLIYYLGIHKKLDGLQHHNLFFDAPFEQHAAELYAEVAWPSDPLMYICAPSKTDPEVAPAGCENLFILIPVAPGLVDTEDIREYYLDVAIKRLESRLGIDIRSHIAFSRSYAGSDFIRDYHAFKGNAYGLANTLRQTAILKPSIRNKRLSNLFYAGQLTVPGPGVPPAIISGEIVAAHALKTINTHSKTLGS